MRSVSASLGFALLALYCVIGCVHGAEFTVHVGFDSNGTLGLEPGAWGLLAFFPNTLTIAVNDTVTFQFNGDHTVTFTPNTSISFVNGPDQNFTFTPFASPFGGNVVENTSSIVSSGIMDSGNFSVTFPAIGDFPFMCLLHPFMQGIIHVTEPRATIHSPEAVSESAQLQMDLALTQAVQLNRDLFDVTELNRQIATVEGRRVFSVSVGGGTQRILLRRFRPSNFTIAVNDTVIFTIAVPTGTQHNVIFPGQGNNNFPPNVITLNGQSALNTLGVEPQPPDQLGVVSYNGSGLIGSGYMPVETAVGTRDSFTVTFTEPGVFPFACNIHEDEGMVGEITVTALPQKLQQQR